MDRLLFPGFDGHGVRDDLTVFQVDDPGRVLVREVRVMGDHDDEAVFGHLFQKVHDLHRGLRVEGAGGLVGQDNVRVVDEGTGNGDTLHLSAGKLVRLLVGLVPEADFLQRLFRAGLPFRGGHVRDGQRQFDVGKHALMRDEVVVLEHEPDRMVAVGVPVLVLVFFC